MTTTISTTAARPTTTSAPLTTLVPTTAPPSTTVEDELEIAIERAQTAMRNCYKAVPQLCDAHELDASLVGAQLEVIAKGPEKYLSIEGEDDLKWTVVEGPTLKGADLATAVVCRFDPMAVTYVDGTANADANYFLQEWHFVPVGNTWKLSESINLKDGSTDPAACEP